MPVNSLQKKFSIPIGYERGQVACAYLVLGSYTDLPAAIEIDYDGNFIIGSGRQDDTIQKFDNDGQYISTLAMDGPNDNNVVYPYKIRIDKNNSIYVLDADKYVKPGIVTENYSIKKFNNKKELLFKKECSNFLPKQSKKIYSVEDIWVTPEGHIYYEGWYQPLENNLTTIDVIYGIDENGKIVGEIDSYFYVNNQGEIIEFNSKQNLDRFDYTTNKFCISSEQKENNEFIVSKKQFNKIHSFNIDNTNNKLYFLGFDKYDNIYLGQDYHVKFKENHRYSLTTDYAVYKYSPEGELISKIDLPEVGTACTIKMDTDGNIYQVYVVYESYSCYTPSDHIEIDKWVPQK